MPKFTIKSESWYNTLSELDKLDYDKYINNFHSNDNKWTAHKQYMTKLEHINNKFLKNNSSTHSNLGDIYANLGEPTVVYFKPRYEDVPNKPNHNKPNHNKPNHDRPNHDTFLFDKEVVQQTYTKPVPMPLKIPRKSKCKCTKQ